MIQINEWLPNPTGKDSENEWIELYNNSNLKINLTNWIISSGSKYYKIKDKIIEPYSFIILNKKETKLNLLNNNGEIKIFNPKGELIDQVKFFGHAPEGKSFSRIDEIFMFTDPTPNQINKNNFQTAQIIKNYPTNINLNQINNYDLIFGLISIIIGFLISLTFWYIIKKNDYLENIFFK